MPCDAVARADARVSNEVLAKLLTTDVLKTVLANFAREAFKQDVAINVNRFGVDFYAAGYSVQVMPGGKVNVTHASARFANEMAQRIEAYLTRVAGAVFQANMTALLKKKFAVESVQRAANGAIVVRMEV